jgi:hypothetical protein
MPEVRFLGCDNDVFCANVQARAEEFEQASGHKLTVRLLDNDFYYANQLTDYLGGRNPADVYMSGPVLVWEQLGLGFVRPLDEFAGRPTFDLPDFFDRGRRIPRPPPRRRRPRHRPPSNPNLTQRRRARLKMVTSTPVVHPKLAHTPPIPEPAPHTTIVCIYPPCGGG